MKAIHLFALAIMVLANGCATSRPLPAGLRTEVQSGGGVNILSAGLLADEEGLLIHGLVERGTGYQGTVYRHLDVQVIGPDARPIYERSARFLPNPIPFTRVGAGRASYSVQLHFDPPAGSLIRVKVDCTLQDECKLSRAG
jgi:hypothetical protein